MFMYTREVASVHGHVIRSICAEEIQRLTHWNNGLAWEPEEIYPTVKGLQEPIMGKLPLSF